MTDIFLYADEAGNLDYNVGAGASAFFGFGTAVFDRDHNGEIWRGMRLRAQLTEGVGVSKQAKLPNGFHAVNDRRDVKHMVYTEIASQQPRFDATFLKKANAYPYVQAKGQMNLYKYAWYSHLIRVAPLVATAQDTLYVIVASLGTAKRQQLAEAALLDVCNQTGLRIVLCVWNAPTSWGLQVADYGLWAMQRGVERADLSWYDPYVRPLTRTIEYPWGV